MDRGDALVAVCSALGLGYALQLNNGFYHPAALVLLLIVIASSAFALAGWTRHISGGRISETTLVAVLAAGLAINLLILATMPIALYLADPSPSAHPAFRAGLAVAFVLLALIVVDFRRAARAWFPALLATFAALGAWMIRASPDPQIDVIAAHRVALAALADGSSPYSGTFPNIYGGTGFYLTEMVHEGRVLSGLPYPPLSLLMAVPGQALLGDIRFAELGALVLGALLVGYCSSSRVAMLAAALVLFTPRVFFVVEQGWTESFAVCWLGATVFALRQGGAGGPLALGLLSGVKQHLVIALALYPLGASGRSGKSILLAASIAGLVTIPFVVWDPSGFFRSVIWLQFAEPFRQDSLSLLSYLSREGLPMTSVTSIVASLGALIASGLFVWWRAPRTPAGFALALGFVLLVVFAFSKKAFCNYYFFVLAAMAASVAASAEDFPTRGDVRPTEPHADSSARPPADHRRSP